MADENDPLKILAERINPAVKSRRENFRINRLAVRGGRPYVAERLSRYPGEPDQSFYGYDKSSVLQISTAVGDSSRIHGRRERTSYVNHVGRVLGKISDHIFSKPPAREGIDDDFRKNVDRKGNTPTQFMREAMKEKLASGWAWIRVDMPAKPAGATLKDAEEQGFRPYWSLWTPETIVDWKFNAAGVLVWIVLDYVSSEATTPFEERKEVRRRRVESAGEGGKPGKVEIFRFQDGAKGGELEKETEFAGPAFLPWVLFGDAFSGGYWVDDVESINQTIMNLSSAGDDSVYLQMYGQLVIPSGIAERTADATNASIGEAVQTILGMNSPIEETPEESGISRYISPDGADLKLIYEAIGLKKTDLWERVGMALKLQSRDAESADAKAWDKNDESALLKDCARDVQEAEAKLIEFSKRLDPEFKEYQAIYNMNFRAGTLTQDIANALGMQSLHMPDEAHLLSARAAWERGIDDGFIQIDEEKREEISRLFDEFKIEEIDPPQNQT